MNSNELRMRAKSLQGQSCATFSERDATIGMHSSQGTRIQTLENKLPKPRRSWRFGVRWLGRFLLPIAILCSSANVVRISNERVSSPSVAQPTHLLLVIAHDRPLYLERALKSVRKYITECGRPWHVVVSLDSAGAKLHEDVLQATLSFSHGLPSAVKSDVWIQNHAGDEVNSAELAPVGRSFGAGIADDNTLHDVQGYRQIARHYYIALRRAFENEAVQRVVIIEEDMEIAPDFFSYFEALSPLLDSDSSLMCISAWNDNGKQHLALDPEQLYRTDFFPGLGWMISRDLWTELEPKWPELYWDDWLRSENQTRGRQCIRPEISRTSNFGAQGVSQSFMYEKHVSQVVLNSRFVDFSSVDLSYLSPDAYEKMFFKRLSEATLLQYSNYLSRKPQASDVIATYRGLRLDAIGKRTGIMTDHVNGIFRTSYRHVLVIPWNAHWAFLVEKDWSPPEGYTLGSSTCCT